MLAVVCSVVACWVCNPGKPPNPVNIAYGQCERITCPRKHHHHRHHHRRRKHAT